MGSPPQSPGSQNDTQWTLIQWPLALGSQQSPAAGRGASSFSSLRLSFHLCEMGVMRIVPWDGKDERKDHGTKAENSTKNIALTATVRIPHPLSPSSGLSGFQIPQLEVPKTSVTGAANTKAYRNHVSRVNERSWPGVVQKGEAEDCGKLESRCSLKGAATTLLQSLSPGRNIARSLCVQRETGNLNFCDIFSQLLKRCAG